MYEGLTEEDVERSQKIKKLAIKTLFSFLGAEVIGFGFGAPLATILAILYGNIADIFVKVYLMPIVVVIIVVVIFVAYPTNLYLSRKLISVILNPTVENVQRFLLVSGKVPLYASINLVVRISISGLIADVWGVIRQQGFVLDRFVTLGISPVMGGLVAGVIFYFVSQGVFSRFNVEVLKLVGGGEGVVRKLFKGLLPMSRVFSLIISAVVLVVSLIVSVGYFFGATFSNMLAITGVGAIMVGVVMYFYVFYVRGVIENLKKVIRVFGERVGKVELSLIYDIEEAVLVIKDYIEKLSERYVFLLGIIRGLLGKPSEVDIFNSTMRAKVVSLLHLVKRCRVVGDIGEVRKGVLGVGSNLKGVGDKLLEVEEGVMYLLQELKVLRGEWLGDRDLLVFSRELMEVIGVLSRCVEVLKVVRAEVGELKGLALLVMPRAEDFLRVGNEVGITFINFQLEMSRINYPMEFRVISDRLNKDLREIEGVVRGIGEGVLMVSKSNEGIVLVLDEVMEGLENVLNFFEGIRGYVEGVRLGDGVGEGIRELEGFLEGLVLRVRELRNMVSLLYKVLYEVVQVIDNFSGVVKAFNGSMSVMVSDLEKVLSIFDENSKMIQELEKNIYTFKKV